MEQKSHAELFKICNWGMFSMKAVVKKVTVHNGKRIIAISDIHGSLSLFKKLLSKISYSEKDVLFLVGDLIEKGEESLNTLRYIMQLSKEREVYTVMGNCDTLWEDINSEVEDKSLLKYMLFRKNSILNDMCKEIFLEIDEKSDIQYIKKQLRSNFSTELNWLMKLPHIIETDNYIFAHAGITFEELEKNEVKEVVKRDAFMEEGLVFHKYVIVGHWPTANYGKDKACCNPIINENQKIVSIDGGNTIKTEGQLNALIIDNDDFSFQYVDDFHKEEVKIAQHENKDTIQISWSDNLIEIIEEGEEFSLCRHLSSKHELLIKNDIIFKGRDGIHCYDCTDYFIEAKAGEIVSIIEKCKDRTLIKNNGIVGWISNDNLHY